MNPTQRYKLIDGNFTPDEAANVLLSLVKSKIDYHNLEKLSNYVRFGEDVAHSKRRIAELRELRDTLQDACRSRGESGKHLRVKGWIEIENIALQSTKAP